GFFLVSFCQHSLGAKSLIGFRAFALRRRADGRTLDWTSGCAEPARIDFSRMALDRHGLFDGIVDPYPGFHSCLFSRARANHFKSSRLARLSLGGFGKYESYR